MKHDMNHQPGNREGDEQNKITDEMPAMHIEHTGSGMKVMGGMSGT